MTGQPIDLPAPPITRPLLQWYEQNARDLPWRRTRDPYAIWVSEIMLQQTRVEAVIPYYERFLRALPDLQALARVPEPALLKLWEGLGYYSRARNLQKAAQLILEQWGGQLPQEAAQLRQLPGIGEYTAGAIASIAFGRPAPAVDGNVLRVFARLWDYGQDSTQPAFKKAVTQAVAALMPPGQAGDFTQALMELGALICLPGASPRCRDCPVAPLCAGQLGGRAGQLPVKPPKAPRRQQDYAVLLITDPAGRLLLQRRPARGLLANLWQPPCLPGPAGEAQARRWLAGQGGMCCSCRPLGQAQHLFTHIQWQMEGFWLESRPFAPPSGMAWATPGQLADEFALPSAFSPFLARLTQAGAFLP